MRNKRFRTILAVIALTLILGSCAGSQISSSLPPDAGTSVIPPSFALASDFPSDIIIPDIDGMRSTAFVVSAAAPAGVIAIDIDANPMRLSNDFEEFIVPDGSGIPSKLVITATDEAFLLTSNSILCFDPTTGSTQSVTDIPDEIVIGGNHLNSDGSQASTIIEISFPGGMASHDDKLFVSTANFIRTQEPALAAPGTILVYHIDDDRTLTRTGCIVTSAHNPTGLSIRNGIELIITNSGALSIVNAQAFPESPSNIDVVDLDTLEIVATIPLGIVAASFHGVEITSDGSRGFLGSAAYGHVYEIDLINRQRLRGMNDPHIITDGSDYITDVELSVDDRYLFVASFETSAVYPLDLSENPPAKGNGFVVGYPAGVTEENPSGANTGAGPIAIRPGSRGADYEGADLMILTGYPGTLVAVQSDAPAQVYVQEEDTSIQEDETSQVSPPPDPPEGDGGDSCQGFAQAIVSVSYGDNAGFGQADFPDIVLGPPEGKGELGGSFNVLSLGAQGEIVIDLGNCSIVDGPGVDFIVFENAFYIGGDPESPYAELAAVAVSDGESYVEFDCDPNNYPYNGCAGWHPVISNSTNGISPFDLDDAGGDQFDLADIGVDKTRYIRIRDLKGSGSGSTVGFDLDAIAVVNGEIDN